MFRLLSTLAFHELYRNVRIVAPCVSKGHKLVNVLPVCCRSTSFCVRHISTGRPGRKDAVQPQGENNGEMDTIDLHGWKSVMRKAAVGEKQQVNNEEDVKDEEEPAMDAKGGSTLEATRELVMMWRLAGKLVPEEMSDEELESLSKLTTKSGRKKFLKYLAIKEGHKKSRKEKQQQKKEVREASLAQKKAEEGDAPEFKNTFLLQFWNRSLDKLLAWRTAQAMIFGQPLVFDLSYDSHMSRREVENTVSQLMEVEAWNRRANEPFHLHFCNLRPDGAYEKELVKRYGAESFERLMITTTGRQHVEVFPRENLVYLTADSPNVLRTFDPSKVYIVGAMVDRSIQTGLSLANAKRLKLATARLPLDEFLHWEIGAKNLTLDQMVRIMLSMKETANWKEALKFVPTRKHDGFHQPRQQKEVLHNKARGVTHHRPRDEGVGRTFKNVDRSQKETRFTGRDRVTGLFNDRENKASVTKVRTSFKNNMEQKKREVKGKMWRDE